jgi:hypothetical protein
MDTTIQELAGLETSQVARREIEAASTT